MALKGGSAAYHGEQRADRWELDDAARGGRRALADRPAARPRRARAGDRQRRLDGGNEMSIDVTGIKEGQKAMWTAGDYGEVAQRIVSVGEYVAAARGRRPGRRAARRRDRHRQRLDPGRAGGRERHRPRPDARSCSRSSASGRPPPASRSSSSRATRRSSRSATAPSTASRSCFGVMFAPRQRGRRRRARPRGAARRRDRRRRLDARRAWSGGCSAPPRSYMPPPPEGFRAAGDVGHRGPRPRRCSRAAARSCPSSCARSRSKATSVEAWIEHDERILGPAVMAKAALEQQGRYEELRSELFELCTRTSTRPRTAASRPRRSTS